MRQTHAATIFIALITAFMLAACDAGEVGADREQADREQADREQGEPGQEEPRRQAEREPGVLTEPERAESRVHILDDLSEVVDRTLPSVVGISTQMPVEARQAPHPFFEESPFPSPFPPSPDGQAPGIQQGMGSGVIISKDGYVLTNNHVVEGAEQIRISINGGREYDAEIIGTDPKSDLAVIQIQDPPDELNPLPFARMQEVDLGDPVVAIGSPFGLVSTVTFGIISATGRQNVGITDYEDFIQTDAAINPGNSGGPLVNMSGEIAGINTAILSRTGGYQGIGFAIPASMAQNIAKSLIEYGEVSRGWLGVVIQTVTPDLARALDLPEDTEGVVVSDVQPDSPAAKAGVQRGDVIVSIAGEPVGDASALRNRVALRQPGDTVELGVLRDGDTQTISVELGEMPDEVAQPAVGGGQDQLEGLTLAPLNAEMRQQFGIPSDLDRGVVVADLEPGSLAARMGLRPGDVILEVNREQVGSVEDFSRAYEKSEDRALFLVSRQGSTLFIAADKPG